MAALGVALGGLVLDRLVFSGNALGPGAAEASTPADPVPLGTMAAAPAELDLEATTHLADRLKELERDRNLDLTQVRDAFWLEGVSRAAPETAPVTIEQTLAAFVQAHELRAVVSGPQGGFVVVGEQRLEIGDTLEGFTLVSIEGHPRRRALFNFDGREVELTMDGKNSAGSGGDAQESSGASR